MNHLEELIREAMSETNPTAVTYPSQETIHAAAVEIIKVLKFGVTDLRSAIFELIYRSPIKRLLIRPLAGKINLSFGHVVTIEKDVDRRNDFKQLFRDNVFHDTVQYQASGGQFELHKSIVARMVFYQARYTHRLRFLEAGANPFSSDFPKSFWEKEYPDEPIFYGETPADTMYSDEDLNEWSNGTYQRSIPKNKKESQKHSPPPVSSFKKQLDETVTTAAAVKNTSLPEEPKISKHQEEKNARQKRIQDFIVLCFNALRYNDKSASQCLIESIWYNADKGQQYVVQSAADSSGSSKEYILTFLEQYYLERYLTLSEQGPIIDKEIRREINKMLISGVGKNGARLIK